MGAKSSSNRLVGIRKIINFGWVILRPASVFALDNIRKFEYSLLAARAVARDPPPGEPMPENLRRFKAGVFQALAHPTRIAIVELLRDEGEVPVSAIHERLDLEQANVSQHLAVLRSKLIVTGRKDGNQVFYSLRDRVIGKILDLMRQYFEAHLNEALDLLKNMKLDENQPK
jgi:ArsR family transcriptional regulator